MLNKIIKNTTIFLVISVLIIASLPSSVSAASEDDYNYIVYTDDLSTIFNEGTVVYSTGDGGDLKFSTTATSVLKTNYLANNLSSNGKIAVSCLAILEWKIDGSMFSGSKTYLFDFYIGVLSRADIGYTSLDSFRIHFGEDFNYSTKFFTPIEYINHSNEDFGYCHFRFLVDGQILTNMIPVVHFSFLNFNSLERIAFGLPKYADERGYFIIREYTQADQIADIGSDISQPDFSGANGSLGSATDDLNSFDDEYKIDMEQTSSDLESGMTTLNGHDMQNASIQVKNWIERFANENTVYTGFIVGGLTLAVCFWIIGRKGWE